jgi:hypothetical protein
VNAGETVETPEGYVGSAVNLAARLCAAAFTGEVLVSQTVRDLTANTVDVRFESAGRRRLKGIAKAVAVHRAVAIDATQIPQRPAAISRPIVIGVAGGVVLAGAIVGLFASGTAGRFLGSAESTSSVAPSASGSSGVTVTDIAIPPVVDGQPEPTPVVLAPGTYRLTAFRPRIAFKITEPGWTAVEDSPDTFELERPDRGYLIGALIQVVSTGPCFNSPTRLLDQTPHALVEWLQSASYVKASDPTPVTAGGYAGLSVEISQAAPPKCTEGPPRSITLFEVGDHIFSIRADERVEVVALDVGRQPVTFLVGALDQATYERTVAAAGPIIQSMTITP